jgi:hypothetical protein
MRALVVYESMFGNTHCIADHLAEGLREDFEVVVVPVDGATLDLVRSVDLVVVGGPTHAHGMTSSATRKSAVDMTTKDASLEMDSNAGGTGLRDWFQGLPPGHDTPAAAFDTRIDAPAMFTGAASHGIAKRLRKHGFRVVVDPMSFLVDKQNHLLAGEAERAESWGRSVAAHVTSRVR